MVCVTPIEAHSPVKMIEPYEKQNTRQVLSNNDLCLRSMHSMCYYFLVRFNNSERFQILHTLTQAAHSYVLLLLNHDHRSLNFVFAT